VRFAAILDGTMGTADRQAQALAGFLRDGLSGDMDGETLVFYHDKADRRRLVDLAPTPAVRLVKTEALRPDRTAVIVTAMVRDQGVALLLCAGGPAGTELTSRLACRTGGDVLTDVLTAEAAAELTSRLACRTGGDVLTDVLTAEAAAERLLCRRNVYSNHVVGRFELSARPWCISLDASWNEGESPSLLEHRILSDTDESGAAGASPLGDVELVELPLTGDLADSRFLVVAGRGAGSREGVERIAKAARSMGAAFGVTRPVAMNAWAPMDRLIGVSGTRTAPALCIVAGASGAPAFYWGIEKASFIVAIDLDDHAQIIANADAVLLDDCVAVVEELAALVAETRR
jgi:electron transfer flavoprotein alpha subunit